MKLSKRQLYLPKNSFGFKKFLLSLNTDLDAVLEGIRWNTDHGMQLYSHSINPLSKELSNIERMVLFLEDRRFFVHNGFELKSLPRGFKRYLRGRGFGGMSTIDQQVTRIVTNKRERTIRRKFRETLLALFLNFHTSKRSIFNYYLHHSYFGYKLEGCEMASQFIFGAPAAQLSQEGAAFLACLLPLPLPKSVFKAIESGSIPRGSRPSDIVNQSKVIAPRWSSRVGARMEHATKNYNFSPKSR